MKEEIKEELKKILSWYTNNEANVTGVLYSDGVDLVLNNYIKYIEAGLEVGKWYKAPTYGDALFYVTDINYCDRDGRAYGFNYKGEWVDEKWGFTNTGGGVVEATQREVESALKEEAKRRGYKRGVNTTNGKLSTKGSIVYDPIEGVYCCGVRIYYNGRWADIIEEPLEITLEEIAEKFGVDVKLIKIKK
jgi:hypothetical protein